MKRIGTANSVLLILGILLAITAMTVLSSGHPSEYAWMPKCPFHLLTGLYCPGCGSTRAVHYLLQGQITTAFRYQPILLSMLPLFVLLTGKWLYEVYQNKPVILPLELPLYRLILITVCLFFLLRNIPMDCFDILRPPNA
ncbi:MAG: DUF2752 domain-containing protein [Planctomycetaceae bacterium]|jgi:hypothetical protein|nr:DUF2752 domain-containing protein [Planctomycetaceae bacterium]